MQLHEKQEERNGNRTSDLYFYLRCLSYFSIACSSMLNDGADADVHIYVALFAKSPSNSVCLEPSFKDY